MRQLMWVGLVLGVLGSTEQRVFAQASESGLISQAAARQVGLQRTWFTRVQVDPQRGRIENVVLQGPTLFVQTDHGLIQAIDVETGRTLWSTTVGKSNYPTMRPAANEKFVSVVNGSTLYTLDRDTGTLAWEARMKQMPSAGCAMSKDYVHVPVEGGGMATYRLVRNSAVDKEPIWYAAFGAASAAPVVSGDRIMWGTGSGYLYADDLIGSAGRMYLKSEGPIIDRVAYHEPLLYGASRDGFVYAMNTDSGTLAWRVPAGGDVHHRPIVVDDAVYVVPSNGGLLKLDAKTGTEKWWVRGIVQFLAASDTRLYVIDTTSQLVVLDAKTGTRLAALPAESLTLKVTNSDSDRIFLGTKTGLLECLREIEQTAPTPDAEASPAAAPAEPAATPPADDDPFATPSS